MLPSTYLFVPASRPERIGKALASGADAVIVDLEDAIAPSDKSAARDALATWLRGSARSDPRVLVRINDRSTPWFAGDLTLVGDAGIHGVVLPKAETPDQIAQVAMVLPADGIVLPLLESARAILDVDALALAPRVQRLAFGTLDYALDVGLSGDERGLLYPASRIALASRAAGIGSPIGGVTTAIDDEAKILADLAFWQAVGFGAKLCIHPRQVAVLARALAPSDEEVAWARRVLVVAEEGRGVATVDGRMVDRPVIVKAQSILARAGHFKR